jgi:hypothetical protein
MKIAENYFIGYVLKFDDKTGIGDLSAFSCSKSDSISIVKFNIDNSLVELHIGKLVKFSINEDNLYQTNFYWASSIIDFDLISDEGLLSNFIDKVTDYSDRILPDNNPLLTGFFLTNNKIHRKYSNHLYLIKKAQEQIDNFDKFDLALAINGYKIEVKESYNYKPGGDDDAWIYISAFNDSIEHDSYINSYLPLYSFELAFEISGGNYREMLAEMWERLGGEIFKKNKEKELLLHKVTCIQNLEDNYNKEIHNTFLQVHLADLWKGLHLKIQTNFDNRATLNKTKFLPY